MKWIITDRSKSLLQDELFVCNVFIVSSCSSLLKEQNSFNKQKNKNKIKIKDFDGKQALLPLWQ